MAFDSGKENKATETKNETRTEKPSRGDDRKSARKVPARTWSVGNTTQGRASEFIKQTKEILKENGIEETVVLQPARDLENGRLTENLGFVIYGNHIDGDFFWHLIVMESKQLPVESEEIKDRNRRYNRDEKVYEFETTSDAIDESLIEDLEQWIGENVAVDGEIVFTNATVVPTEVSLEDEYVVSILGYDAEDSNLLISDVDTGWSSEMLAKKSKLVAKLSFTPNEEALDLSGLPLRSDIQISVSEIIKDKQSSIARAGSGKKTVIELDAYVSPRWVGHDEPDRDDKLLPACYVPEVVMSQSNPYHDGVEGGNFGRFLLGLSSLTYLKDGEAWMRGFETNLHSKSKVSSLAYGMDADVFPGGEIPDDLEVVDEDSNENENWLRKIFHRADRGRTIPVEFAVLIREGSVGYTTSKLLLDVADDVPGALDKLNDVLDTLTNGESVEFLDIRSASDVIAGQVRVPMGYYKGDGNRPAEEIDTMYVLTRLKDNYPEKIEEFFECLQPEDREFDHDEAMTKLIEIYQLATDDQFKLKGFGTKLYIVPEFLEGLAKAIKSKEAGLNMEMDSNIDVSLRRSRRSTGRRGSFGLSGSPLGRSRRTYSGSRRRGGSARYRR